MAMESATVFRLATAACSSLPSRVPLGSPPHIRASGDKRWTGNLVAVNRRYNLGTSFPANGISALRFARATGRSLQRQFQVAAVSGEKEPTVAVKETVIPGPDYRIPIVLLGAAGAFIYSDNLLAAAPVGLLGLLLLFQTTRVKFVFEPDALEVKIGEDLQDSGENVFVGGQNRWKYSTFTNWELWWPNFPILVYFKESQTKPEGQIHFFPVIFDGKKVYDLFVQRAGPSQNSGPK